MNSSAKSWGNTISKENEKERIWIGNLDVKNTECVDIEQMFKKYGKIIGIDINNNGFAFVQFENVDDAQKAVVGENQKFLKNRKLEVKMFGKKREKKFDKFDKFDKKKRNRSRSPASGRPDGRNKRFFNSQRGAPQSNFRNNKPPFNHPSNFNQNAELNQFNQFNQLMQSQQLQQPPPQTSTQLDHLQQRPNSNNLSNPPASNELEIIVANKEQWQYAEMLEKKLRNETCLRFIDLVFPHSEEMILVTLKDLYEKKTLYAVVVNAINEQNNTFTLHILHSQSEFSNVSINEGIQLICADFIKELSNPQSIYFRGKELNSLGKDQLNSKLIVSSTYNNPNNLNKFNLNNNQQFSSQPINNQINNLNNNNQIKQDSIQQQLQPAPTTQQPQQSTANKLPNNVAYILRMTLDDNTAQFLSISQIDSVIEYYNNEKAKLLSKSQMNFNSNIDANRLKQQQSQTTLQTQQQQSLSANFNPTQQPQPQQSQSFSNLLDDPQVKAALNQLMGYKSTPTNTSTDNQLINNDSNPINNYVSSSLSNYNNSFNNLDNNLQSIQQLSTNFNTNNLTNHNIIPNHKQIRQQSNFYNKESPQFRNNKNNFRSRFN